MLISGDGHWWIALDYRKRKEEPPVVYIESEGGFTIELAKNFDSFLTVMSIIDTVRARKHSI